jgi:hypothetical protein
MNKRIVIDNQEFELVPVVPVVNYKIGDWVLFNNGGTNPVVRKIVSDDAYRESKGGGKSLDEKYKEWMTEGASKQYKKDIVRKASSADIANHLIKMARAKGFVAGINIRGVDKTVFHKAVQGDLDYYYESDELAMSGMIIYKDGEWAEIQEEPKFSFGGYPIKFDVIIIHAGKKDVTKETTGTASELADILTNFFRPMPFGSVKVKYWTLKQCGNTNTIPTFHADNNDEYIDSITIGCLTGKYSELVEIYEHSQEILKNWKPAKGFDK